MEKVKLSRSHDGREAGEIIEIPKEQKEYFERVGLIEKDKPKQKSKPKTK